MATLGIALREHFPQYYGYFSQRSFLYGRQRINGHNRLLGRIKGVDGIKTGYTRASGFNLVSSVADGNRRLVAVVMAPGPGATPSPSPPFVSVFLRQTGNLPSRYVSSNWRLSASAESSR